MKEILNAGVRLLILTLVAALLLSGTYLITKGPIEEQALASQNASRLAVMPGATGFELVDTASLAGFADNENVKNVSEVYRVTKDGEPLGYTFLSSPQGFGGPIPVTVGILGDGKISQIAIGDITETAGIGTRIVEEADFSPKFAGLATNELRTVDTLSGATISSAAVKTAVRQAFNAYELILNPPAPVEESSAEETATEAVDMTGAVLEPVDISSFAGNDALADVKSVSRAMKDGQPVGYVVEVAKTGYHGLVPVTVSITEDGIVFDYVVGTNTETEGLGTRAITELSPKFKGLKTNELRTVDVIAGASVTSQALKDSFRAAFTAVETLTK
ncbi:MAG: FMN-binding protein [Oscillospiraceae bacterium]|jgi:electron transport complex protein RnfG|nr:FMN-binding protein [Oscillospiraceae bacterium]